MSNEDIFWDDDVPPVPPLEKGSKLFINDDERTAFDKANGIAYFGFKRTKFFGYAEQYMLAADKLIQTIDHPLIREGYVLPIIFLYRHYVELQLKGLILLSNEQSGNPLPLEKLMKELKTHNLDKLWKITKPILERTFKRHESKSMLAEMEPAEEYINEFKAVDAISESFRYPFDKGGNPIWGKSSSTLQGISYINLQHIKGEMEKLYAFFGNSTMLLIVQPSSINTFSQNPVPYQS